MCNSRIISDKELSDLLTKDKLGTSLHVSQLDSIVKSLTKEELTGGFNIGIYGSWGSGKSSIVKTLERKIKEDKRKEYTWVYFDCWKYAQDDLRRAFLVYIAKHCTDLTKLVDDKIYAITATGTIKDEIDRKRYTIYIGLAILCGLFCGIIIPWVENGLFLECNRSYFIVGSLLWIFGSALYEFKEILRKTIITKHTTTHTKNSFFSNEQFEELYNDLMITKKYNNKIKIFVFDNIDRCEIKKVKEILMTVKTFLNKEDCIFIIPIDYDSVCGYYADDKGKSGDEYLRKIFNLAVHIKQAENYHLRELVLDIFETQDRKSEFDLSEQEAQEIGFILGTSFARNPRKIKQFLNNLGGEYLLFKDNENVGILAVLKYLLIKQEIGDLYKQIERKPENAEALIQDYKDRNKLSNNMILLDNLETIKINRIRILNPSETMSEDYVNWHNKYLAGDISGIFTDSSIDKNSFQAFLNDQKQSYLKYPNDIELRKLVNLYAGYSLWLGELYRFTEHKRIISNYLRLGLKRDKNILNFLSLLEGYSTDGTVVGSYSSALVQGIKLYLETTGKDDDTISNDTEEYLLKVVNSSQNDKALIKFISPHYTNSLLSDSKGYRDHFDKLEHKEKAIDDAVIDIENYHIGDSSRNESIDWFIENYGEEFPSIVHAMIVKNISDNINSIGDAKSSKTLDLIRNNTNLGEDTIKKFSQMNKMDITNIIYHFNHIASKVLVSNIIKVARLVVLNEGKHAIREHSFNHLRLIYSNTRVPQELKDEILMAFKDDINKWLVYSRPYKDLILSGYKNNETAKGILLLMITKTKEVEGERKGLEDNEFNRIVTSLHRDNDYDLIEPLWSNTLSKNLLKESMDKLSTKEYVGKIELLKEAGCKFDKSDKAEFGKKLSEGLLKLLNSEEISDMEIVSDFLLSTDINGMYLQKKRVQQTLEKYPMSNYSDSITKDEYECYDEKRLEAIKKLKAKH